MDKNNIDNTNGKSAEVLWALLDAKFEKERQAKAKLDAEIDADINAEVEKQMRAKMAKNARLKKMSKKPAFKLNNFIIEETEPEKGQRKQYHFGTLEEEEKDIHELAKAFAKEFTIEQEY